ncbi:MAG: hypothetical protein IJT30_08920 [Muribaculaceae bacterium]|nr:hypothetical protein [Muribaculaceae bacterium]
MEKYRLLAAKFADFFCQLNDLMYLCIVTEAQWYGAIARHIGGTQG